MMPSTPIRVLIVDDHAILRAAVRALLQVEPDIEVVGEAADGGVAVRLAAQLQPDVVLMDLNMMDMDGLSATRSITTLSPDMRVLVLTVQPEASSLLRALDVGAFGFVNKRDTGADLVRAIRTVHRGEVFLHPSALWLLLSAYRSGAHASRAPEETLTDNEREVLRLTAAGYSNVEIGRRMYLSPKTVDYYRQRVMDRLSLHHRSEVVQYALRSGLLHATQEV